MTDSNFGMYFEFLGLAHVQSDITETEGFMTYAAVCHQEAIKMFLLHSSQVSDNSMHFSFFFEGKKDVSPSRNDK